MVWLPTLPDCETMPTPPGGGMYSSRLIEKDPIIRSATLTVPRQLGPRMRMVMRAMSTSSACMATPSAPSSANPDDSTMAAFTPRAAQSRRAAAVAAAGTARIASSGAVGVSRTEAYAVSPCTVPPFGLTG